MQKNYIMIGNNILKHTGDSNILHVEFSNAYDGVHDNKRIPSIRIATSENAYHTYALASQEALAFLRWFLPDVKILILSPIFKECFTKERPNLEKEKAFAFCEGCGYKTPIEEIGRMRILTAEVKTCPVCFMDQKTESTAI